MAKRITKKRLSKAPSARAAKIAAPDAGTDPIKHIVVLMFENRSFDQMLGGLQVRYPQLDGSISAGNLRVNADKEGRSYQQLPLTAEMLQREIGYDPKHEHPNVMYQLYDPGRGNNQNFVRDFSWEYPDSSEVERQYIMSYYPAGSLPVLHQLADQFAICDKWFSSVPGPTWANRLFMYGGTSQGTVRMPENELDVALHHIRVTFGMDTIFDRLSEGDIKWRVYFHDYALSSNLIPRLALQHYGNFRNFAQFESDVSGDDDFPGFCIIEPRFFFPHQDDDYNEPDLNYPPNDCHPPHSVFDGEHLLAKVYNALRKGPLWDSTLLVVLYDEYGGFYDHVTPPTAVPPDGDTETFTYAYKDPALGEKTFTFGFNTLGCRVPALLVSPWVEKTIIHTQFEHVSVLKYVVEKFKLRGLGDRIASSKTNSIGSAIKTTQKPDIEAASSLRVPSHADRVPITGNQKALLATLPLRAKVGMMREHPKKARIRRPGTV